MDFRAALRYLNEETTEGIRPDLSRITLLCEMLGDPQKDFKSIHITGTNGKTTTARMIESILTGAGLKTGFYTSPHLSSYTERIKANGKHISEEDFARLIERTAPLIQEVNEQSEERVTQFEALTALAFQYFSDKRLDCAVVEVGMGGSWDATNLVDGKVALITNVELEHTDRLGDSIEQIAREKAGIIKKGADVVMAVKQPSVLDILAARCKQQDARLFLSGRDFKVDVVGHSLSNGTQTLNVTALQDEYDNIRLDLIGRHQAENAGMAVVASELFINAYSHRYISVLKKAVPEALSRASSPGRLEVLASDPMIVLDGAHNPAAAARLRESLEKDFDYDRLILVLGILADKDVDGILDALLEKADVVVATASNSYRAFPAEELGRAIEKRSKDVTICDSVAQAVTKAKGLAGKNDMILITGSIYTIGEAKEHIRGGAK